MSDLYFLTKAQVKEKGPQQLSILKKYGLKCRMSDFAILLGGHCSTNGEFNGIWWLHTDNHNGCHSIVSGSGWVSEEVNWVRYIGARPALRADLVLKKGIDCGLNSEGIREVKYLDYPTTIEYRLYSWILELAYKTGKMHTTGKKYVTDSADFHEQFATYSPFVSDLWYGAYELIDDSPPYTPREHIEYEYNGQKYIRFVADKNSAGQVLTDGRKVAPGEPYWVRVEPITWLIDEEANVALAKQIVFAGVPFIKRSKDGGDDYTIYSFIEENIGCFLSTHTYQDDTKALLDKVDGLIKSLPSKERKIMLEQRKELLQKYEQSIEKDQRVDFTSLKNPISLTLENDIDPEVALYTGLYDLSFTLARQESLVQRIKQIDSYLKLFKSPITELPKETQTKEDMIRAVVFYSNKYHGYQGKSFKDKLQENLTSYKEQCEAELKKYGLEDDNKTTLEHTYFDKDLTLMGTIMDTLDKAVVYNENIGGFVDFIEKLMRASRGEIENQGDSDSMASIVSKAKAVIESLEEKRKSAELERELQEIVEQRIAKINEMLNSKEILDPNDITEIEREFAERLQPFLVKLDKEANRQVSLKDITEQIANSRRILQEENKEENTPIGIIDSFVSDIHNSLLSGKVVPSDKEQIIKLVTGALNKFSTNLDGMSSEQIKAINNFSYPIDEEHPLTVLQSSLAEISNLLNMHNHNQKGSSTQHSGGRK